MEIEALESVKASRTAMASKSNLSKSTTSKSKKTIGRKKTARSKPVAAPKASVAYDVEMIRIIKTEAYLLAEKDGFRLSPEHYWFKAEEITHNFF